MVNYCKDLAIHPLNGSTVVDVLRNRALQQPAQRAFTFLLDGETESASLTYQELDRYSRAIASQLQALGLSGERALLLYPSGLDYLAAFFGCLYAGVVAVPAYPPRNHRNTPRIVSVIEDAQAAIALTTTTVQSKIQSLLTEQADLNSLQWLTTDNLTPGIETAWSTPKIQPDTLAFLQYTSGSTGTPKGVMVSHGNLLHNAAVTYQFMEHSPNSTFVSWLPMYHDMGLIGGILQPLYGGFPCVLMPPAAFLQRPYHWLQAISSYRGTTSGAPNFAYELCVQKVTPEQRSTLDLSSWSVAFNGAEPIRQQALERFAAYFIDCGFRPESFYPCYGMAEATLMVSGGAKATLPKTKVVQKTALERHQVIAADTEAEAQILVSCGRTLPQQQIVIAHPETLTRCPPGEVGEIWVSGPSVGHGYWNRLEATQQAFQADLADTKGPFLRTGDLGFLDNGELFITGRVKDLIIIRGRNLYPQDIELTVEKSHPALRAGGGAAFSVEVESEERLVLVQELEFRQQANLEEVVSAIRQAVAAEHEVQAYAVVLIKPGSIPKTSSGKIQRRACKAEFLQGTLEIRGSSILESVDVVSDADKLTREVLLLTAPADCQPRLEAYLQQQIAEVLQVPAAQLDWQQPLIALGLDSLMVFDLKNRLETNFGVIVSVADLFQNNNVSQLAAQVLSQLPVTTALPTPSPLPKQEYIPLSYAQQRLWFFEQLKPNSFIYNIPAALQISGSLNIAVLEQSLNEILRRHQALRTNFKVLEGEPRQVIADMSLSLPVVDLQELPKNQQHQAVQQLATVEAQQPFDLTTGLLLRAKLLQLEPEVYVLLLVVHHIVADGWSMGILMQELTTLYEALIEEQPSSLPELPIQYADFTVWQRQWLQGKTLKQQLAYWQQQLSGSLPVLALPTDYPRPALQSFRGARQSLAFPRFLSDALKTLSQQEKVTLFITLLTAFQALLHIYTGQEDLIVGTDVANRSQAKTKPLIGFFVNQLVLRTNLSGNPTFRELLGQVRDRTLAAYSHQDLPFDKLVEALNPERDLSRAPLFQVKFVLQNAPMPPLALAGLQLNLLDVSAGVSMLDLFLSLENTAQGLRGFLEYDTALFTATTIKRMLVQLEAGLNCVVAQPDIRLSELGIALAQVERQQQEAEEKLLEAVSRQKLADFRQKASFRGQTDKSFEGIEKL